MQVFAQAVTDQERITKLRDGTWDQTVVRGPNPTGFCVDETLFVQETSDRIEVLGREIQTLTTAGIIEVAVRNPSVMDYMKHWEGRAEAAEAKLAKAMDEREQALNSCEQTLDERDEALAKLTKTVETLRFYSPQTVGGITFVGGDDAGKRAAARLAELEKQND